jgi:hypothetical protein
LSLGCSERNFGFLFDDFERRGRRGEIWLKRTLLELLVLSFQLFPLILGQFFVMFNDKKILNGVVTIFDVDCDLLILDKLV